MGIAPLQETGSRFRDAGMSAPACSRDFRAESSIYIMTAATWACSIFLSGGNMLGKPTAHNSWGAASVSGKLEPFANTTRTTPGSTAIRGCQSVLAFMTKQELLPVAEAMRIEEVSKRVKRVDN